MAPSFLLAPATPATARTLRPISPILAHGPRSPLLVRSPRPFEDGVMNERVLLVEDDPSIRELATIGLSRAGYRVRAVGDGREALGEFRREPYDLVLLDVMLPTLDGFEVCREIRKDSSVPVVMLTARTDTTDVVVGLELGADDYVTKPFEMPELVARIRAVLRRAGIRPADRAFAVHDLSIDPAGYTVQKGGVPVELTATEFRLLLELARRPGQVFTREMLLQQVWDYDYLGDSRMVDVAVQRLRAKIEDDPAEPRIVRTVRGVGYRLEKG
jgi:two-component system, OmpR family, response regulator MtrA